MRHFRQFSRFIFALALLFLVASPARAQFSAVVQGTVLDPDGAAVSGASVTLTNQATSISQQSTTTSEGFYRFSEIPPGRYTVTVEAKGFTRSVTQDVDVSAERPRGLDVKLQIGQFQ